MSAENDLLQLLDPAIRQRIEADYPRFAPLIALMGAWKQEIEGHVTQIEKSVVQRLTQELFPIGAWRFPAQMLVVPEDLVRREVSEEMLLTDRLTGTPWTPCGSGKVLPTRLESWSIKQRGFDEYALVCEVRLESKQSNARLLLAPQPPDDPEGQEQLAFVCGSEPIVAELAGATWAVQHPGEPFLPIGVSRYLGYLDFERALGAARMKQRQLEAWLPPFYPYTRKFLRFFLSAEQSETPPHDWEWLGKNPGPTLRLAASISEAVADRIRQQGEFPPLILNAIPVAQMRTVSEPVTENPDRVGDSYKIPFMGVRGCFAATAREYRHTTTGIKVSYHPVRLLSTAGNDPRSQPGAQNVDVLCDRSTGPLADLRVRIHYECYGENAATPTTLHRPPGLRYTVPMPMLGSMNSPIVGYEDEGARRSWYQALLRAPQLTQGDVLEILAQIPDCKRYLDLDPDYDFVQLDVENRPWIERTPWDNYLWPSFVSEASLLEQRATYLTRSQVAIIPVMRLNFRRGAASLPGFLQEDLMQYVSSVISRYFMIGWYRVVGRMMET